MLFGLGRETAAGAQGAALHQDVDLVVHEVQGKGESEPRGLAATNAPGKARDAGGVLGLDRHVSGGARGCRYVGEDRLHKVGDDVHGHGPGRPAAALCPAAGGNAHRARGRDEKSVVLGLNAEGSVMGEFREIGGPGKDVVADPAEGDGNAHPGLSAKAAGPGHHDQAGGIARIDADVTLDGAGGVAQCGLGGVVDDIDRDGTADRDPLLACSARGARGERDDGAASRGIDIEPCRGDAGRAVEISLGSPYRGIDAEGSGHAHGGLVLVGLGKGHRAGQRDDLRGITGLDRQRVRGDRSGVEDIGPGIVIHHVDGDGT